MYKYLFFLLPSLLFFASINSKDKPILPKDVAEAYNKLPKKLDYNIHVKPILSDKCFACHGNDKDKRQAGLRLDTPTGAFGPIPQNPDIVAIVPRDLENSEAFQRIISANDPDYVMPPPQSHLTLSAKEKAVLVKWIEDGAEYKPHWAFVKPEKREIPTPQNTTWGFNNIDKFILSNLEQENLKPSKEASKEVLLRRLSLDLTGLSPTLSDIDNFLNDKSPTAYEKQVDRLLSSLHYGEKMASDWLDLARFADSHGYTVDRIRDMSPYRDWVINAFNENMKYDTFIHQQLAGDLMPNPTRNMLIATAFNRNHAQNVEGGIIEEEYQTEYVRDRTDTFGEAFMGISVGCAKCHDHKFDPISQKNYYELYAFFNNVKEAGQISWDDAMPTPTLMLPTKKQEEIIEYLQKSLPPSPPPIERGVVQKWYKTTPPPYVGGATFRRGLGGGAFFDFEDSLKNTIKPTQKGVMRRENGNLDKDVAFEPHNNGKALVLDGDAYLDLKPVGVFRRTEPFTIGMQIFVPKDLKEGVIFHKCTAERLYNFKGFHLYLRDNKFEIMMAHTAPSNALTRISRQNVPREQWIHVTMTYDGSSKAEGFKLYLDGTEMDMETTMDQLYKDILFKVKSEPGLQIGGWWRGLGFKGGKVDDVAVFDKVLTHFEIEVLANKKDWNSILSKKTEELTVEDLKVLSEYYDANLNSDFMAYRQTLKKIRTVIADSMENVEELMVMQEMPKPKKAYLLQRGSYEALGEEVFANTPQSLLPFSENLPKNRYGLAQWLTNPDHPLTARVAVNRYWKNLFGVGLVKTAEDFGNQGEMPSNLALLDYLAIDFIESGWDVKRLMKNMVMSAAYRQDSKTTTELREFDPENRLLARGPSFRMTAEMIRDNALMASGLLNKKIGGKSVKPYQPDGLWEINNTKYTADTTSEIYRRSLYVLIKRSVPNPTLATFDAPAKNACTIRRQKTNTPLQALVTLNDPTFVEAAKVLGGQMNEEKNVKKSIAKTYRKLTGLTPTKEVVLLLNNLYKNQLKEFNRNPQKAIGWLKTGFYKVDNQANSTKIATNAVIASTIMNSDAGLVRR